MDHGVNETSSFDETACSGEPSSTSASSSCSSPFERSKPGRASCSSPGSDWHQAITSLDDTRRHSLGSSKLSEELDALSHDLELPRLRRRAPSVSSISWAGSDVSRSRRATSLRLSRTLSSSHEGYINVGEVMLCTDDTSFWSEQTVAGDAAMQRLHCLTIEEMTERLEDRSDWPSSLVEVRNKFWENSSAADPGEQGFLPGGSSPRHVSEGVANKMLQYYSFSQQLFLDIVLTSQALTGGWMESDKALPGKDGGKIGPLQSIASLVPRMGCLGTLTSYSTAEGSASRKLLLAKRVAAVCPNHVAAIESVAEVCARVLAVFREKRLAELEVAPSASAERQKGRKAVHQRLCKGLPLAPTSIEAGVKLLVVQDLDRMLWPVEVGQVAVQQEGQLGERLMKFCIQEGGGGTSSRSPAVDFAVNHIHQKSRSSFRTETRSGGSETTVGSSGSADPPPPPPPLTSPGGSVSQEEASTVASSASTQSSVFAPSLGLAGGDSPRSVLATSRRGGERERRRSPPGEREVIRSLEERCNSLELELASLRMSKPEYGERERERENGREREERRGSRQGGGQPTAGGGRLRREEKKAGLVGEGEGRNRYRQLNELAAMQERTKDVLLEVEEKQRHLKVVRGGLEEVGKAANARQSYDEKITSLMIEKERLNQQLHALHSELRQLQIDIRGHSAS